FDRALVIGLGTGNTLRTVSRLPFQSIDVAELSPNLVEAAKNWFSDVNGGVLERDPRVQVSIADGRNFLLLSRQRYDMLTIEITSLWINGEADLYNKEFYELCRSHLGEHGVLQQWVALHHLRQQDLLVLLNTARLVFPHVALFQNPTQPMAFLIASNSPLEIEYQQMASFDSDPSIHRELSLAGAHTTWNLLGELVLFENSFRNAVAYLPQVAGLPADFVSSDLNPYLEYASPRGLTLTYDTTVQNVSFLH